MTKFLLLALAAALSGGAGAASVRLFKSPTCGCCEVYVRYLEKEGFSVKVQDRDDMTAIKQQGRVAPGMGSCHTAFVGGYTVEGHVPAAAIRKLLQDKPRIIGVSAPGMPAGSPGMGPYQPGTIAVHVLTDKGAQAPLYGRF